MDKTKIGIIIGSTRPGRFGEIPAKWIHELAEGYEGLQTEIIDLKDINLPFFDSAVSPSYAGGKYENPIVQAWADKIKGYDGYIFIVAEYNHGYTAVLKNALDHLSPEWANKPVGYIAYGSVGGARAAEQLKQIVAELRMASVRTNVHIMAPWMMREENGDLKSGALDLYVESAKAMLTELENWAKAFKTIRS